MRRKISSIVFLLIACSLVSATFGAAAFINRREIAGYLPTILQSANSETSNAGKKHSTIFPLKSEASSSATSPDKDAVVSPDANKIPIQVSYLFLFNRVADLDKKASEEESKGKDGKAFRQHYKNKARLTDEQDAALSKAARDCLAEVSKKDAEAMKIIDKDHAKHSGGRINAGEPFPTPPPELNVLKQERDAIIMRYLDVLKASFSEADFIKFRQFVEQEITGKVSAATLTKDLRPVSENGEPVTVVSPDSSINPETKQSGGQK